MKKIMTEKSVEKQIANISVNKIYSQQSSTPIKIYVKTELEN